MTNATLNGTPNNRTTPTHSPSRPAASKSKNKSGLRLPKADKTLYWSAALAPWGLAILLLAVSMPHLASGFMTITHSGPLACWLLAIAIDASQVICKLQLTLSKDYTVGTAAKWTATGVIVTTSLLSMALNTLAFLAGATDKTGVVLAYTTGILLPLLIIALSYVGSTFALSKARKQPRTKGRTTK